MPIAVAQEAEARYPEAGEWFSPSESYPEYGFAHVAAAENATYALVRRCLREAGLDAERYGRRDWNPLGAWVPRGSRVFVLCNFVQHRRRRETAEAFQAKCIHGSVLRAVCDYALLATGLEGSVEFGNSALQSCEWERVLSETGAAAVLDFYRKQGAPVSARDLRLYVAPYDALGRLKSVEKRDASGDGVEVVLGEQSLLSRVPGRFRILDYPPERIEAFHAGALHRYVIHRAVLESDVVISLSKLKTHEKVGVTCALKGFVGTVGHKDCLAHHRRGGPDEDGDEYPAGARWLAPVSRFQEWVQERQDAPFRGALQIVDRNLRRAVRRLGFDMGGAWSGNDTCWRMALDLARIVTFADRSGALRDTPQRRHLSFIDGLVSGEGDGPLSPSPLRTGGLLFSDDVTWGDRAAARLMGFDPRSVPLLREAPRLAPPITDGEEPARVLWNGRALAPSELPLLAGRPFRPPRGWRGLLARRG